MKIRVNGMNKEFNEDTLSVSELLKKLKYSFPNIIVRYKENTIKKENFSSTYISDNDDISIIHNISGG